MTDQPAAVDDAVPEGSARSPSFLLATLCFAGNLLIISAGLFALEVSLHILLFLCLIWTGLHLRWLGHDFIAIREMMNAGISRALALGGMLFGAGMLQVLLAGLIRRVQRTASLIATTIGAGLVGNLGMGEAYISIVLNCQLFRNAFDAKGLDRAVLSRSVEEGATMTTGLIPWTTAGVFYAATLGIPVLAYAPFAFFNYLNPVISVVMAALGVGLLNGRGAPELR